MATNLNTITVCGNLTKEPELRFTPAGAGVVNLSIAVNRSWKDRQSDEWKEEVSFFDVTVWREMAENAAESLNKGDRVVISGRLEQQSWTTDEGDKRSKVQIVAEEIGPSLRFATAEVKRNERRDNTSQPTSESAQPGLYDGTEPF